MNRRRALAALTAGTIRAGHAEAQMVRRVGVLQGFAEATLSFGARASRYARSSP